MYPSELVAPMKGELVDNKFEDVVSAERVDELIEQPGTVFFVINSVCGCAAGSARPAAILATQNEKLPNHLATVFAGVDREAVDRLRKYCLPFPPSSPSMALFKDGKLVHFIERHHIEGSSAEMIAENIKAAFDEFC